MRGTSGDQRDALNALIEQIDIDERMRIRGVQQAILDAQWATWMKRAEMFEWAAPKAGEYVGQAGEGEVDDARERCLSTAQACRNRARFLVMENADE